MEVLIPILLDSLKSNITWWNSRYSIGLEEFPNLCSSSHHVWGIGNAILFLKAAPQLGTYMSLEPVRIIYPDETAREAWEKVQWQLVYARLVDQLETRFAGKHMADVVREAEVDKRTWEAREIWTVGAHGGRVDTSIPEVRLALDKKWNDNEPRRREARELLEEIQLLKPLPLEEVARRWLIKHNLPVMPQSESPRENESDNLQTGGSGTVEEPEAKSARVGVVQSRLAKVKRGPKTLPPEEEKRIADEWRIRSGTTLKADFCIEKSIGERQLDGIIERNRLLEADK